MRDEKKVSRPPVSRFEDLVAWQKARHLTRKVYEATHAGKLGRDFGLAGQMQRAAVSIMSNIAEGNERGRPAEYFQFLSVAKASCAELRSQLYVASDAGLLDAEQFEALLGLAEEVGRVVGGLRIAIKQKRDELGR